MLTDPSFHETGRAAVGGMGNLPHVAGKGNNTDTTRGLHAKEHSYCVFVLVRGLYVGTFVFEGNSFPLR